MLEDTLKTQAKGRKADPRCVPTQRRKTVEHGGCSVKPELSCTTAALSTNHSFWSHSCFSADCQTESGAERRGRRHAGNTGKTQGRKHLDNVECQSCLCREDSCLPIRDRTLEEPGAREEEHQLAIRFTPWLGFSQPLKQKTRKAGIQFRATVLFRSWLLYATGFLPFTKMSWRIGAFSRQSGASGL